MHSIPNIFPPSFTLTNHSSYFITSDGNILAAAAGQLRTFDTSDNKKIQKFSGHPVSMSFLLLPMSFLLLPTVIPLVFTVICCT